MTSVKPARRSLPLTERDIEDLAVLRRSPEHRRALASLADVEVLEGTSEASFLHAVMEAGIRAVREQVEAAAYAQAAAEMNADERQSVARRRRPSWADA